MEQNKLSTIHQKTKSSRNKTRVKKRKKNQQKKNHKQVLRIKVNLEKAHDTTVESLDMFFHAFLNQHLLQKINGNSKQKEIIYVLSHRRPNHNMGTKNTIN